MTLLPDKHIFEAWQGGTFRTRLTLYVDEGITPRNLAGYTARLEASDLDTGAPTLSLTTENGGITLGGAAGTIDLFISDEETALATWVASRYELKITSPSGDTDPLLYGTFIVRRS